MTRPVIALLTDFGTRDWYVAAMKGVLLSRCPNARLVDITHEVPPQDVVAGAFILAAAAPWFPRDSVFLAVVDPGVGTGRPLLAVRAGGRCFVGPDNGLLAPAVGSSPRVRAVRLRPTREWLSPVSATFQGRDVLAPVAAALARGRALATLGTPVGRLAPLPAPAPQRRGRAVHGQVVHIDAFGNLITNLPGPLLTGWTGASVRYKQRDARVVSSYGRGRPRELIAVVGSLGLVELAIREGSAAWTFGAARGDEVRVTA
jgi:hypothetical protein